MPTHVLLLLALVTSACTTFHLPRVFLRGSITPAVTRIGDDGAPTTAGTSFAFQAGLAGELGEAGLPTEREEPEPTPIGGPLAGAPARCSVPAACAWERRALAEARARVIGGAP